MIEKADGLTDDAFRNRAIIYRLKENNALEMLSFDVDELLNGKISDIPLKREDQLVIASNKELLDNFRNAKNELL